VADQPIHILVHPAGAGNYLIYSVFEHYQVLLAHIPGHVERDLVRKIARLFAVSYGMIEVKED
jgi:hypothetical protein